MEEEKQKKKKLTLSVSSKTNRNVTSFAKRSGKTSVVIEKKSPRRWTEKKIHSQDKDFNKSKSNENPTCILHASFGDFWAL